MMKLKWAANLKALTEKRSKAQQCSMDTSSIIDRVYLKMVEAWSMEDRLAGYNLVPQTFLQFVCSLISLVSHSSTLLSVFPISPETENQTIKTILFGVMQCCRCEASCNISWQHTVIHSITQHSMTHFMLSALAWPWELWLGTKTDKNSLAFGNWN